MDQKETCKKSLFLKAWKRCQSIGSSGGGSRKEPSTRGEPVNLFKKSKSWHCQTKALEKDYRKKKVAPAGCFSVYVGPQKQRFVVKTRFANHPLFQMLLEDAELEYGFASQGPLELPCDDDLFYKVLAEMNSENEMDGGLGKSCGPFGLCSPIRHRSDLYSPGYKRLIPPGRSISNVQQLVTVM